MEYLKDFNWIETFAYLREPFYWGLLITLGFLLLLFVVLRKRQPRHFAAFNATSGQVMVSRKAIEEIVKRTCDYTDFIDQSKVRINTRKKKLHMKLALKLKPGGRLSSVTTSVQKNLEVNLRKNIGIENLGKIDVIVTGISGSVPAHLEADGAYDETVPKTLPDYQALEYVPREEIERRDQRIRELEEQAESREKNPEKSRTPESSST